MAISSLGVPAPAGMNDWYESMSWTPRASRVVTSGSPNSSFREGGNPEGWGSVREGSGPPYRFQQPTPFHALGVPGPSRHERLVRNGLPSRQSGSPNSSFQRRLESRGAVGRRGPALPITIYAPRGKFARYSRRSQCSAGSCPPLGSGRGGVGGSPQGILCAKHATPPFHPLVCRRQPAWVIGTKACPGLRSGIDAMHERWGRIPPLALTRQSAPPLRHSREGGNPEEWGSVRQVRTNSLPTACPVCHGRQCLFA